ncbi:hypothetical protein B0O99DRAFT_60404 [Bisporella sp. PMI_857]|nr:hypothetical protein B0O99DRAFT_60404 [Bisporella sp. PMI_857]
MSMQFLQAKECFNNHSVCTQCSRLVLALVLLSSFTASHFTSHIHFITLIHHHYHYCLPSALDEECAADILQASKPPDTSPCAEAADELYSPASSLLSSVLITCRPAGLSSNSCWFWRLCQCRVAERRSEWMKFSFLVLCWNAGRPNRWSTCPIGALRSGAEEATIRMTSSMRHHKNTGIISRKKSGDVLSKVLE